MTPEWTFQTNTLPLKARIDYKSMPSISGNGNSVRGLWQGSGFLLKDLEVFQGSYKEDLEIASRCNACHSKNVYIIYLDHARDQSGCDIDLELECYDCGKFTLAKGWN